MSTASGLTTDGLPRDSEVYVRQVHGDFLNRHDLTNWPLEVRLVPLEPVINSPEQYHLTIICGINGVNASSERTVTATPAQELNKLGRMFESHYANMRKLYGTIGQPTTMPARLDIGGCGRVCPTAGFYRT